MLILHSGSYTFYESQRNRNSSKSKVMSAYQSIEYTLGGILATQSELVPKLHLMLTDMSYSAVWPQAGDQKSKDSPASSVSFSPVGFVLKTYVQARYCTFWLRELGYFLNYCNKIFPILLLNCKKCISLLYQTWLKCRHEVCHIHFQQIRLLLQS